MRAATYSGSSWHAPTAQGPLAAVVRLPGSKSLTNRELVLSALADAPSVLRHRLRARDTDLMVAALAALGVGLTESGDALQVAPAALTGGIAVDCGLAGTLMRFLPPVAALAAGPVRFDGDPHARQRPMATTIGALRDLGAVVEDGGSARLPFTVVGAGALPGGDVTLDASGSSQFVSGLLLAGARFTAGLTLQHRGGALPSLPHIAMSVTVLEQRGVIVGADPDAGRWHIAPQTIGGREVDIEPDLSNAAPFLAAALIAGGRVTVPGWPAVTTQVGDRLRQWLAAFGADVGVDDGALTVDGGRGVLHGAALRRVDLDLSAGGELAPTLVGLAAFADGISTFTGIGHLRGHETDRLAALATELGAVGIAVEQTADGLVVHGDRPAAGDRAWQSYADHRMATTGALLGLATPGLAVDDVATTAKTLPGFVDLWTRMLS